MLLDMFSVDEKRDVMKSRIISLIFKQLSTRLSLSKNQNNQLAEFMKSMIFFRFNGKRRNIKKVFL